MCGADPSLLALMASEMGSPPRVRSRQDWAAEQTVTVRITSACAEQTLCRSALSAVVWVFLFNCLLRFGGGDVLLDSGVLVL